MEIHKVLLCIYNYCLPFWYAGRFKVHLSYYMLLFPKALENIEFWINTCQYTTISHNEVCCIIVCFAFLLWIISNLLLSKGRLPLVKKPRGLKVKSLSSTVVKVKWRRPKLSKSTISGYALSWRRKKNQQSHHVNVTSRSYIISGLETNTWYAVWVQTISKDGRLSNRTTVSYKTSQHAVTKPPRNVTAKAMGTTVRRFRKCDLYSYGMRREK